MQVSRGGEGFSPINERAEEGHEDGQHAISRKNLRGILVEGDLSDLQIMRLCFKQFQASLSSVPPSRAIFFSFFLFLLPPLERPCASTKGRVGFSRRERISGRKFWEKPEERNPSLPLPCSVSLHLLEEKFRRIWNAGILEFVQGVSQGILKEDKG